MPTQIDLIKKHRLAIRGTMGQHLLIDPNVQRKIVASLPVPIKRTDKILEIGPGLGALTEHLIETGAVYAAIEKDKKFVEILREEYKGRVNPEVFRHQDILEADLSSVFQLKKDEKIVVVSNLPYYITAPILFKLVDFRKHISQALVMMQKEVAQRILAGPGTKDYGRLTLGIRYAADVRHVMDVKPGCFTPKPEVDSSVLLITFHEKPPLNEAQEKFFYRFVELSFAQRRKTLLHILCHQNDWKKSRAEWLEVFKLLNFSPTVRAEELLLKDFLAWAETIASHS